MDNLINFEEKNQEFQLIPVSTSKSWNTQIKHTHTHTHTGKYKNKGQKQKLKQMAHFPNILSSYETLIFTNN